MSDLFMTAARAYIEHGWAILVLKPDNGDGKTFKRPLFDAWQNNYITSIDEAEQYWGNGNPKNYGIGIVCGEVSGVDAIDIDTKHEGVVIPDLETVTQQSSTGGLHMLVKHPLDRELANWTSFLPHIDLRTDAGQIVSAPTNPTHVINGDGILVPNERGPYQWIKPWGKVPLADMPEWVKPREKKEGQRKLADEEWIERGTWNNTMTSLAGKHARTSKSEAELYSILLAISDSRSRPEDRHYTQDDLTWLNKLAHRAWEEWRSQKVYLQSESGQAEYFADNYSDRAKFNWKTKEWMVWAGHWFEPDSGGRVRDWVDEAYRSRRAKAVAARDAVMAGMPEGLSPDKLKKWMTDNIPADIAGELAFANAMGSHLAQEHVRDQSAIIMGSKDLQWDLDPDRIGVLNGVVNLRSGTLEPGESGQMISKHIDLDYKPQAPRARWLQFVNEIFDEREDFVRAFKLLMGYALTGLTREQVWFLCYGGGSNGKSTALEDIMLGEIFGMYGSVTGIETFTKQKSRSNILHDLADLEGKRFVVTKEPGSGGVTLDEERLKSVTTGGRVRADRKHRDAREFAPVLKLWIETNHLPRVKDFSDGFWRRIIFIPFLMHFAHLKDLEDVCKKCGRARENHKLIDVNIVTALRAEREGILAWLVEGAVEYYQSGLVIPLEWRNRAEEYKEDEDDFGRMLEETFEFDAEALAKDDDIFKAYILWASRHNVKETYKQSTLTSMIKERHPEAYVRTPLRRYHLRVRDEYKRGPEF